MPFKVVIQHQPTIRANCGKNRRVSSQNQGQRCITVCAALSRIDASRFTEAVCAVGASVLLLLSGGPAHARETLTGVPRIIDGDTIEVSKTRVRLFGIDAPETKQSCSKGGSVYDCGIVSKQALERKIGSAPVVCDVKRKDLYGRSVAICSLKTGQGEDLNGWLVSKGYATAYRRYSTKYIPAEEAAKAAKKGVWSGAFEDPEQWRRDHPPSGSSKLSESAAAQAVALAPVGVPHSSDCLIKGNINIKGDRIYHVPGGRFYDSTKIDLKAGERWFCNEPEAVAAGWRPSK